MSGKHCRLYDENLVHNIMISTGLSVLEFIKEHKSIGSDEICDFVELNAHSIIEDTIEQLNSSDDSAEKKELSDTDEGSWPFQDGDNELK
jgi:hypothetical protein